MTTLNKVMEVFKAGGFTLVAMLGCSLVAVAVAIERGIHLWNFLGQARGLSEQVMRGLHRGAIPEARAACERSRSPLAEVFLVGFERLRRSTTDALGAAVERERQRVSLSLRGPLWVLGTIGATAPFLGLFGTVVGIMGAFQEIGKSKQAGIEIVGPYIAEALIATAVGIAVAILALLFFNFFQARIGRINIEVRLLVEEFVELLREQPAGSAGRSEPGKSEPGKAPGKGKPDADTIVDGGHAGAEAAP